MIFLVETYIIELKKRDSSCGPEVQEMFKYGPTQYRSRENKILRPVLFRRVIR